MNAQVKLAQIEEIMAHVNGNSEPDVMGEALDAIERVLEQTVTRQTYTLAQVRDGTGWSPNTRFIAVSETP